MKRIFALACALLLSSSFLFAQESEENESDITINEYSNLNETGDQYVRIALMVTKPLNFDDKMTTGGAGMLGYHKFITPHFAAGFDVCFGYNPTIGGNMFTYVPFVFNVTYQPTYKKFEFPVTCGIGFATETYLNKSYFPGFVFKPQAGVFYRVSPSWSFGAEADFMYLPQWYSDSSKNDYGMFGSLVISARYHF